MKEVLVLITSCPKKIALVHVSGQISLRMLIGESLILGI